MPKTLLAIGAHYDDCVYGIPGILLQAVRKHYRVVLLSVIGDFENWAPTKGRGQKLIDGTIEIAREYGAELRYLKYASHRFDVDLETKRAVAQVVAEVQPDIAFHLWPHDTHHDHEVAAVLSQVALRHGDRLVEGRGFRSPRQIYTFDNGPRHTIGFTPNTFVDITTEWPNARDWLGRFMALTRNVPYDPKAADASVQAKETLAAYRGLMCGARYAEGLWAPDASARDILA